MKKILLLLAVTLFSITLSYAQPCTPNPMYADSIRGFYPTQMPDMVAGQAYNGTVTVVIPTDTCVTSPLPLCLYVQAGRINSIDGLPAGFTVSPSYNGTVGGFGAWINGGTGPNWTSGTGCLTISAPASAVDAAIAANSGDMQLHYTYQLDLYMLNQDPQSPILANYTWGSAIGVLMPFNVNGGGSGNPNPSGCASAYFQGNQTSFAGLLPNAGTFDLDILTTGSCTWTIIGNDTWFSYSPASGSGNDVVTFTYDANNTGVGRFAELDIDGQPYVISQMADTCAVNITYDTTIFDNAGGWILMEITMTDPNCFWNLVTRSICEGVTVDPMSGTGSTSVTVTFAPNPNNTPRQCELDFGNGNVVTLNQQAGTVGIKENGISGFSLYPNPANDMVTISLPNTSGKEVLSIYTVAGQLLSQTQLTASQQQVSTTNLANGIYVFALADAQGNTSHKKVVINR